MSYRHKPDVVISERIREARERAGLSQRELAEKMDVGQTLITHWEKARSTPSASHVRSLCEILDVDANWLVGNDTPDEAKTAWPEGWKVLHRASGQLSAEKRKALIDIMKAALSLNKDEKENHDKTTE